MFVKPQPGHLLILVRMPANALIDFLLPTLANGNWVDLANAHSTAIEGANTWIADMLSLTENGTPLPRPEVLKVRLSRVNDPAFRTFDDAMSRIKGEPLPAETLVLQEQITVDALLQAPIMNVSSQFAFTPRFARLGVVVDTAMTFVAPDGRLRPFAFQADPDTFQLNPARGDIARRFAAAAIASYRGELDFLLFVLCAGLAFRARAALIGFTVTLAASEALVVLALHAAALASPTTRSVVGVFMAALVVYIGVEAILARPERAVACSLHDRSLAMASGVLLGAASWFGLRTELQFAGAHALAATLTFTAVVLAVQSAALLLCAGGVTIAQSLSRVPRAVVVIPAAVAIHVAWRQLLERADGLALVSLYSPEGNGTLLVVMTAVMVAVLVVAAVAAWRRAWLRPVPQQS